MRGTVFVVALLAALSLRAIDAVRVEPRAASAPLQREESPMVLDASQFKETLLPRSFAGGRKIRVSERTRVEPQDDAHLMRMAATAAEPAGSSSQVVRPPRSGPRVVNETLVVTADDLTEMHELDTTPAQKAERMRRSPYVEPFDYWTPSGRPARKGSAIARALSVAKRSFVLAEATERGTRLSLHYIRSARDKHSFTDKMNDDGLVEDDGEEVLSTKQMLQGPLPKPYEPYVTHPVEVGMRGRGARVRKVGPFCTTRGSSIPTNLDRVLSTADDALRADQAQVVLLALYYSCKSTITHGLKNPNKDADWGLLGALAPKKGESLVDLVKTFWNNVQIFMDATGGFKELLVNVVKKRFQNADITYAGEVKNATRHLFDELIAADGRLRGYDPQHRRLFHARVLPGSWSGYFAWLSALEYVKSQGHEMHGAGYDNMALLQFDGTSTEVVFGVGGSKVRGLPQWVKDQFVKEEDALTDASGGPAETSADESSFLQTNMEARSRGPVSLLYPLANNPGRVISKSFMGAGLRFILAEVLKHVLERFASGPPGSVLPVPCLAKGVRVGERASGDPTEEPEAVCWTNRPIDGRTFDRAPCTEFSSSRVLLNATVVDKMVFEGTNNIQECAILIREVLLSKDLHIPPISFLSLFSDFTSPVGPFNYVQREKIQHLLVNSQQLQKALQQVMTDSSEAGGDSDILQRRKLSITSVVAAPRVVSPPTESNPESESSNGREEGGESEESSSNSSAAGRRGPSDLVSGLSMPEFMTFLSQLDAEERGIGSLKSYEYNLPLLGAFLQVLLGELLHMNNWQGRVHVVYAPPVKGREEVYGALLLAGDKPYERRYERQEFDPLSVAVDGGSPTTATNLQDVEDEQNFDDLWETPSKAVSARTRP